MFDDDPYVDDLVVALSDGAKQMLQARCRWTDSAGSYRADEGHMRRERRGDDQSDRETLDCACRTAQADAPRRGGGPQLRSYGADAQAARDAISARAS